MLKASEFWSFSNPGWCCTYLRNVGGWRDPWALSNYYNYYYLPKVVLSKPQDEVTPEEDEAWAALFAYCTKPTPVETKKPTWVHCHKSDLQSAIDLIKAELGTEDVAQQVINDMQSRREFGIKKYGRPATPHNGRHALKDAYEEVLDLAVYLKQQLLEDGQSGVHVPGDVGRTA